MSSGAEQHYSSDKDYFRDGGLRIDSLLRAKVETILQPVARLLREHNITANMVTLYGLLLNMAFFAGVAWQHERINGQNAIAWVVAYVLVNLSDKLDGMVAKLDKENNDAVGQLVDGASDRVQETIASIARASIASGMGSQFGVVMALAACVTNSLPSLARARANVHNVPVAETGDEWWDILGTRAGRIATGTTVVLPPAVYVLVQPYVDLFSSLFNIKVTLSRVNATYAKRGEDRPSYLSRVKERAQLYRHLVPLIIKALRGDQSGYDELTQVAEQDPHRVRRTVYEIMTLLSSGAGAVGFLALLR